MAQILILGGTRWLGRTLVRTALRQGHAVACLARGSDAFEPGTEAVRADRDTSGAYAAVAGRPWDLVVELTRFPAYARSAVEALSPDAAHWAFVSSCSVYAQQSVPGADENAPLLPALASTEEYADALYGEAKAGCEWLTVASRGNAALLVRAGLIGGPGDPSGRSTYWPRRFAAARDAAAEKDGTAGPVLVPDDSAAPGSVQIVDVRDLAAFILEAGLAGRGGPVNAVGAAMPLGDVLASAASAAGYAGPTAGYPVERMERDGVDAWAGPRSLPLVLLPTPEYAGFARRDDARALRWGLVRRPLAETFADILEDDAAAGAVVPAAAGAGLAPQDEATLLAALAGGASGRAAGEPAG
ncbi:hypothetical protein ACQ3I4_05480 [Zafaria sp. Z1313]|uniref:hypothetical protein n=1 Tax=unclassified Zafaria TaxID=2828765 RepID=UPI002E787598|nr:hypothetical protein [Zafaria sp. J156]MEE1621296.1 hypothetical protein [Zafaria sp. J156]